MKLEGAGVQGRGRLKRKLDLGGNYGGESFVDSSRRDPGEDSRSGQAVAAF